MLKYTNLDPTVLKYTNLDPKFTFMVEWGWVAGLIKGNANIIKAELAASYS